MQAECADGYGFPRWVCIVSYKKRSTWCGVLGDLRSQIKYSLQLACAGSGTDGTPYIADRNGNPNVFNLERNDDGLWLNKNWAKPDNRWNPNNEFAFRLRNSFFSAPTGCGFSCLDYRGSCASHPTFSRFHLG